MVNQVGAALRVPEPFKRITLAFGSQLKNTICLGRADQALISPAHGDMDAEAAVEAHQRSLMQWLNNLNEPVNLSACDLHPDYMTTRIAEEWCSERQIRLVRVQHHHAHLAACLADNDQSSSAIGLCFDGTGYGTDGTIWGGEFLVGNSASFDRIGFIQPIPMPGGEKAVTEPWRMALAWLQEAFGESWSDLSLELVREVTTLNGKGGLDLLLHPKMMKQVYPRTSSLGRLFDAVAALVCFGGRRQSEGQAAMQLEKVLSSDSASPYPFEVQQAHESLILSPISMFKALVRDLQTGVSAGVMSRRFHEGLVDGIARMCGIIRDRTGLSIAAFSGGCFQNSFLMIQLSARFRSDGFRVLTHHRIPTNDEGISLGQAVVANAQEC